MTDPAWIGRGKVRARQRGAALEVAIEGISTQAIYFKPLVYEFFRKVFRVRPRFGDFVVEILV
ncbi:MAG: RusA family crossover junction endodeoxyribonuclease, partial [Hyphomonadaceae bacterium]|nr:RusA family crossover junction endodeoxyribonuclease [Hyphomonadaceae bacterium]